MIEAKIPHFLGGVSRQAESQRDLGTLNEQINAYPNISSGLEKRRGMYFHKNITLANADDDYLIHWIKSTDQTYIAFISADATEPIQIFNLATGTKATITYNLTATEGADYTTEKKLYLTQLLNAGAAGTLTDPVSNLKVLSIFDSSFIVNKTVTCSLTGTADNSTTHGPSHGVYGNSQDGTWGITATTSVFPSYSDLPGRRANATPSAGISAIPGSSIYYKTLTDSVGHPAGVYLADHTTVAADEELYIQQLTDYDNSLIDYKTMPLKLVNTATNTFKVEYPTWSHRKTGDDIINAGPSFIGRTIDDMVYHKNRLWIMADEFIVSSQTGDFFNFWPNSSYASVGSDPIDETIADEGLNKIMYAIPFRDALILFTEGGRQFEVRSVGNMAPDTVSIVPTTSYYTSPNLRPKFMGNNLYFLSDFDNYGQVMEYFYLENASANVANSVTQHIPDYLPTDFTVVSGDVNNGLMLFSPGYGQNVHGYSVQWSGDEKLQNAFYKFSFADIGYEIISHSQVDSQFYFAMKDAAHNWMLTSLDPVNGATLGDIPYRESLDYVEVATGGTYNSTTNTTPVVLTYKGDVTSKVTDGSFVAIGHSTTDWSGFSITISSSSYAAGVTTINLHGDWEGESVVLGAHFPFRADMNLIYPRDENNRAVLGTFTMKRMVLVVDDTIQFTVEVDTPGREELFSYNYSAIQLDASDIQWDNIPLLGTERTQNIIFGIGHRSRISITDTSEFPITLVSAEVRGVFNKNLSVR